MFQLQGESGACYDIPSRRTSETNPSPSGAQAVTSNPVVIIAILLAAAVLGGMIAHRLRQPVILGYLVIGAVVGPRALGLIGDRSIVEAAANIGVALLMFTL